MSRVADLGAIVARCGGDPHNLLQMLHQVQDVEGRLSTESMNELARLLGVPRARVAATASFYHLFHGESHGDYEIRFSDNVIDQLHGQPEAMRTLCKALRAEPGRVTADGSVYIDTISDIGLADQPPGALINGRLVPALDHAGVHQIIELIRSRRPVDDWPVELFDVPDNVRRAGPLLDEGFVPGGALEAALALGAEGLLREMETSGLRGRGGAGFGIATKWRSCATTPASEHFVVCNADEGEPGTFKDRVLLASHADRVLEGMTLAAMVLGARRGFLYLRGEYRCLLPGLEAVLARRRRQGLLGQAILGRAGFDFDVEIHLGAGAYVCGEETALIESLEGKPGRPRNRPPYPNTHGYRQQPTVVNNVESFACVTLIALHGGAWFAAIGTEHSSGTKLMSVAGDCERPGIYEYPYGVQVREVLADCGARDAQAVQVGGPSGTLLSWREFDRRLAMEDVPTAGAFMIFSRHRDMFEVARNFSHFFADESCGFCTPCRVGTALLRDTMDKLAAGKGSAYDLDNMQALMRLLNTTSHCGLGRTAAQPVVQSLQHFPADYERRLRKLQFEPAFDLDAALEPARRMTGRDDPWAHLAEE